MTKPLLESGFPSGCLVPIALPRPEAKTLGTGPQAVPRKAQGNPGVGHLWTNQTPKYVFLFL